MLRDVVDQARQGDEEAFGALVREVGDRCIFIAHRILRDANVAEDAVQVALVQVWRELHAGPHDRPYMAERNHFGGLVHLSGDGDHDR